MPAHASNTIGLAAQYPVTVKNNMYCQSVRKIPIVKRTMKTTEKSSNNDNVS
jgi:hypothetical protein